MLILGIETSCDETAVGIVEDGKKIISNYVASQIDLHSKFGGIVPEIASRKHLEIINFILDKIFADAKINLKDLDGIAVTYGPGLEGALLIGVAVAKTISLVSNLSLIGVNHLEAHIYANFIEREEDFNIFPAVSLIVSGGHTDLIYMREHLHYELLGRTRDDAAGEAFDKVARTLGLGFPGGPIIDKLAEKGEKNSINFTRPYLSDSFDFSFSGLKTQVINWIKKEEKNLHNNEKLIADVCANFQQAVVDVLVSKTIRAAQEKKVNNILLSGGVAVNRTLRKCLKEETERRGYQLFIPPPHLCVDNAAMVAGCGYYKLKAGNIAPLNLDVVPYLEWGRGLDK